MTAPQLQLDVAKAICALGLSPQVKRLLLQIHYDLECAYRSYIKKLLKRAEAAEEELARLRKG